jgi:hypothetical protein
MRYIGRVITQGGGSSAPSQGFSDSGSFINVKSFGATGLDRYFEGRVNGSSSDNSIINIGNIVNFSSFEGDYFKIGQELYAFFYLDTSTPPPLEYDGFFSNLNIEEVGLVTLPEATGPTTQPLRYFIYAFNPTTGKLSPYVKTFTLNAVFKNPAIEFNTDNYVKLSFTRQSSNWLPVVFRQWGNEAIKYLGVLSNNVLGPGTSVVFNDRGPTEIPTWDEELLNSGEFFPELFSGIISLQSNSVSSKTIISKRRLRIVGRNAAGNLECVDAESNSGTFTSVQDSAVRVRFKFDDTKPFQDALNFAAANQLKDVFAPTGTYCIRNLKLYSSLISASGYSGISFRGSGEGSIIKKMGCAINPLNEFGFIGLLGSGVSNRVNGITISNLAFDGNKQETFSTNLPENDVYGLRDKYNDTLALEYVDSARVTNCSFYNGAGSALYSLSSNRVHITNNRIYELSKPYELNVPPLKVRESSRFIAQGNLFENCSGEADFTGIDTSLVSNNIINNCGDSGIQLKASETWNAQGNLTSNSSGSIIRSVDLYQNDYSRVSLDIKRGVAMTPVYFTVTDGGLPISIAPGSIEARVLPLNFSYTYDTLAVPTFLQVLESKPQLRAGIFALTAPVSTIIGTGGSNQNKTIQGTNNYELLDTEAGNYGYGYRILATVSIGNFPIDRVVYNSPTTVKIFLRNSTDLLSISFFTSGNTSNDSITTSGIGVSLSQLSSWPDGQTLVISEIDTDNAAIVIQTPLSVAEKFINASSLFATPTGALSLVKNNYFIADGNIYVSE